MRTISCLLIAVLANCCSQRPENEDEAVRKTITGIVEADNDADIERVLSYYAESAVLVPPGKPEIAGVARIRRNYENIFVASTLSLSVRIDSIRVEEKLAVGYGLTHGEVLSKRDSTVTTINDSFKMLLESDKGSWKITRLTWSPQ